MQVGNQLVFCQRAKRNYWCFGHNELKAKCHFKMSANFFNDVLTVYINIFLFINNLVFIGLAAHLYYPSSTLVWEALI